MHKRSGIFIRKEVTKLEKVDFAPCLVSKIMMKYFKEKKISCFELPRNSPDLNSIKNLWAIVEARFRKMYCANKYRAMPTLVG